MSIKISNRDVIWSYLGIVMTLGVNLFLLPLILNRLSENELGLWYTFLAVGNIAVLFDFGFKATMARNITYAWCGARSLKQVGADTLGKSSSPNLELLNQVMKVSKLIYLIISLLAGVCLLTLGSLYIIMIANEMDLKVVIIAWIIYIAAVFLNLYYGYLNCFLSGVGAVAETNKANVIARLVQLVVSMLLLMLGMGIISVAAAYLAYSLLFRQLAMYQFYKYEQIGHRIKPYNKKLEKTTAIKMFQIIWHNAWRDGLVSFAAYLNSQSTTLLCSAFLTLGVTATYGLSLQLVTAIASVSTVYFSTYQAKIQAAYIEGDMENTGNLFATSLMVYYIVYIIGAVLLCTIGIPVLAVIKSDTTLDMRILVTLLFYMFLYKNHILCASYIAGTNRIIYMKAFIISGSLMLIFSILLLKYTPLGIWALILPSFAVEACYDNWKWPRFVMRELNLSVADIIHRGLSGIKEQLNLFLKRNNH